MDSQGHMEGLFDQRPWGLHGFRIPSAMLGQWLVMISCLHQGEKQIPQLSLYRRTCFKSTHILGFSFTCFLDCSACWAIVAMKIISELLPKSSTQG